MNEKAPKDFYLTFSRDFGFLSTFLYGIQMVDGISKYIGVTYNHCYFTHSNYQIDFYRSIADEQRFTEYVGKKCLEESSFLDLVCTELKSLTNEMRKFITENQKLTTQNINYFLELFEKHFAYHLAVYWAGDYMGSLRSTDKTMLILSRLSDTRAYNERILPEVEHWLLSQKYISFLTQDELVKYIKEGVLPDAEELKSREDFTFAYIDRKTIKVSSGNTARKDFEETAKQLNHITDTNFAGVLKGVGASKGIYQGVVQNIWLPNEFVNIRPGVVLVTSQTRPDYTSYIKQAGAIVVDEGAFLGHATILAREFKIPTVIGTKIGTKVLNDGDMVEVDANNGIVRIIPN